MYDDLLVNGTSITTIGRIVSLEGLRSEAPLRGANITYPNVAGETFVSKVRSAYVFTVPIVIVGSDRAAVQQGLETLRALVDSSASYLTLTRKLSRTSGNVTQTCKGELLTGLGNVSVGPTVARVALDFVNLDGVWT